MRKVIAFVIKAITTFKKRTPFLLIVIKTVLNEITIL